MKSRLIVSIFLIFLIKTIIVDAKDSIKDQREVKEKSSLEKNEGRVENELFNILASNLVSMINARMNSTSGINVENSERLLLSDKIKSGDMQSFSQKTKIVVLPFKNVTSEHSVEVEKKISSLLASKLASMSRFEVIDRTELERILSEQKLSMMGVISADDSIKIGQLTSARLAVTGNISSLNLYREEIEKSPLEKLVSREKVYKKEWHAEIGVEVKILDVEKGIVLGSITKSCSRVTDSIHTKQAAVDRAIADISENVIASMKHIFSIKSYIISKSNKNVLIRLGSDMGISTGDEFNVYSKPRTVVDKFSGKEFVAQREKIGVISIVNVHPDSSEARILKGSSLISEGDTIEERSWFSLALDFKGTYQPFNVEFTKLNNKVLEYGIDKYNLNLKQEKKSSAFGFGFSVSPAYKPVGLGLGFNFIFNFPLMASTVSADFVLSHYFTDHFSAFGSIGVNGIIARGTVGTVTKSLGQHAIDILGTLFVSREKFLKNNSELTLTGMGIMGSAKLGFAILLTDSFAIVSEAGYNFGSVYYWKLQGINENDELVDIGNVINIPTIDMFGIYAASGIRVIL